MIFNCCPTVIKHKPDIPVRDMIFNCCLTVIKHKPDILVRRYDI